tara:strand:+ start:4105 stop:4338 length:234 start_codon:yes stop_codon:yes gene_type:complete
MTSVQIIWKLKSGERRSECLSENETMCGSTCLYTCRIKAVMTRGIIILTAITARKRLSMRMSVAAFVAHIIPTKKNI